MTKPQRAALEVVAAHGKGSSYELRRSLTTLNALVARGYARRINGPGSIAFPRTSIIFYITDAGRAALSSATGDA